jgi:hypothetical protein
MAAFDDLCSLDEVWVYAVAHLAGRPHVSRIWSALPLASENSWSPREPIMRMVWMREGGFPAPLVNVPLFDRAGNHLVTPDLLDPVSGWPGSTTEPSTGSWIRGGVTSTERSSIESCVSSS